MLNLSTIDGFSSKGYACFLLRSLTKTILIPGKICVARIGVIIVNHELARAEKDELVA
jgi:hypothetical protein